MGSLRTINTSEIVYASTYGGNSPDLLSLGPGTCSRPAANCAGLMDEVLAGGRKSGYTFTYTPGPQDAKGRIESYTVSSRPVKYSEKPPKSFFTDETGVFGQTSEDRPATAQDPALAE